MIAGHAREIDDVIDCHAKGVFPRKVIFFGEPAIGKYTVARALAYFFERGSFPRNIQEQNAGAVLTDAFFAVPTAEGSIGIDEARRIKEFLRQRPLVSPFRTVVIGDAERLTGEAQNALLKVSEEPPEYAIIILITRDPELLLPTLVSRFEKRYFAPVPEKEIAEWLVKLCGISQKDAKMIAAKSFGKPGFAFEYVRGGLFEEKIEEAERFLVAPLSSRRNFLKSLLEDPSFQIRDFLDALLVALKESEFRGKLWHDVVELRRVADTTPVNPRIQLSNLWTKI